MVIQTIVQPDMQMGSEISALARAETPYNRIVFVSAFASLKTILRLREDLLAHVEGGSILSMTLGIDLDGTSREVLEELMRWVAHGAQVYVFHNSCPYTTFHPKFYLFQSDTSASLLLGSNNLTDGGFYTNYEASTRCDFDFPADDEAFARFVAPLQQFIEPVGVTVQRLSTELIATLVARGELETEAAKLRRVRMKASRVETVVGIPANPFGAVPIPKPPLLPLALRATEAPQIVESESAVAPTPPPAPSLVVRPTGTVVWKKKLSRSDALTVREGSNPVGGVRLTKAKFKDETGHVIDQATYFFNLFNDFGWRHEEGKSATQVHTFVAMRITIKGVDYGVRNFEISHNPAREAHQHNFTTTLRWGREFSPVVRTQNLVGNFMSLYRVTDDDLYSFWIDITDV